MIVFGFKNILDPQTFKVLFNDFVLFHRTVHAVGKKNYFKFQSDLSS